jgi:hypothetical protein
VISSAQLGHSIDSSTYLERRIVKSLPIALVVALGIASAPVVWALDGEPADHSKAQACEILKNHMARIEGLPGGRPLAEWYCDFWDAYSDRYFYVVALWTGPSARLGTDHAQSAGHFAVAKRSDVVLYFDLSTEALLPIPAAYYSSSTSKRPCGASDLGTQ